ncbi:MAG TPA: glycosyltransferase family 39 protein, partial [Rhodospirillaceae bacterium]|nr:glycosyltransferase family 39 protein [Rhodospirillaceae bacterium]
LLAATLILVSEAHQAKTDAVLLACVVAAQGVLGRLYLAGRAGPGSLIGRPGQGEILLFWLAQGLGILIKGPIVPLISLLTLGSLWIADRRLGWLAAIRPVTGLLVVAAMVGPWLAAVSSATQGQFLGQAVKGDLLPKLLGSQESHGAPPGYFLLLATVTLWPLAGFALPGLVRAVRARQAPALRFMLAWIVPAWIMFEAVPTKLPHYILPTVPALALLAGIAVAADDGVLRNAWSKAYFLLGGVVGLVLAGVAVAAPLILGEGFAWASLPAAAGAVLAAVALGLLGWRGRFATAAAVSALGSVIAFGGIYQGVLPALDRLWLSQRVVAAVPPGTPLVAVGFHEPSLVFLAGTATVLNDAGVAADILKTTPKAVAVVEAASLPQFQAAVQASGRNARLLATIDGFNYPRGRPAHLTLWGE